MTIVPFAPRPRLAACDWHSPLYLCAYHAQADAHMIDWACHLATLP
mgnify:CR=1 FL=1